MRIDFYPKLRLNFVFWGLNFIRLFVNRTFVGEILCRYDFITISTYFRPIIYSVEVWHESTIIILLSLPGQIFPTILFLALTPFCSNYVLHTMLSISFPIFPWIIPLFFQLTSSISIFLPPGGRHLPERGWVSPSAMVPVIIVFI